MTVWKDQNDKVLVLMALQPSFFNSFSQTWEHLWFVLLTMGSTVAKCRPHKNKELLFVYPRKIFFLNNWRPITLLNTVYKIASLCIAARHKTVPPKLIGDDFFFFFFFLKVRYIGENVRSLYDTLSYANQHQTPGI